MESEHNSSSIATFVVIGLIIFFSIFSSGNDTSSSSDNNYTGSYSSENTIDRYDAKTDYWDEIKEYIDGTYTVIACSENSGNCYDLDLDINDGNTRSLYFPNGGYVDIYTEFDSDGSTSGYDDNDADYWELTLNDSDIDDAIDEWAYDNNYTLE